MYNKHDKLIDNYQDSQSAWFGANIWPHSQCKIVSFFPI